MNSKTDNLKKPWEKISIEEIQPYPAKYTKIIILSYIFVFFNLLDTTDFFKFDTSSIALPITICVYGTLLFAFVYVHSFGQLNTFLNFFKAIMIFIIIFMVIAVLIFNAYHLITLNMLITSLNSAFVTLLIFIGPIYLCFSHYPRSEKHGYLLLTIGFVVTIIMIYLNFLHISN
jgi:hypothetical protein